MLNLAGRPPGPALASVEAVLQVWEGQSHAQYIADITAPETREYHDAVARFFDLY